MEQDFRQRFDAIGPAPRAEIFSGALLSTDEDAELQAIVKQVAAETESPIAIVTLVLDKIQLFRAHTGLPEDLQVAAATDRAVSFCQLVVRDDEQLEVNNAAEDSRVPQDHVDRYGIMAYLGSPLYVGDEVAGSLCVIDVNARDFSDADRALLDQLAAKVSLRLSVLAASRHAVGLIRAASEPAFAEMRNLIGPLQANIAAAKMAATEIGPLVRIASKNAALLAGVPASGALEEAVEAEEILGETLDDLVSVAQQLSETILALEQTQRTAANRVQVPNLINLGCKLAHHHTKLIGGPIWPELPDVEVVGPKALAVSAVSAFLSAWSCEVMASNTQQPLELSCEMDAEAVTFAVPCPMTTMELQATCAAPIREALEGEVGIRFANDGETWRLRLQRPDQTA